MLIQEIIYLGFVVYGVISLLMTMAYVSLKLDDKRLREKKKDLYDVTDFESRLKEGEVLNWCNLFTGTHHFDAPADDELHFISKHVDEIIVKKYIKKGGSINGNA